MYNNTISISKPADNSKITSCFLLGLNIDSDLDEDKAFVLRIDDWVSYPYTEYNGEISIQIHEKGQHTICAELYDGNTLLSSDCICIEVVDSACKNCGYSPCCCPGPKNECALFNCTREKNIALVDCSQSCYQIGKDTDVVIVDGEQVSMLKLYLPKLSLHNCQSSRSILRGREIRVVNNSSGIVGVCPSGFDKIATSSSWVMIDSGDCVSFFEHRKWYFC